MPKHVFVLSQEHLKLAIAEVERLIGPCERTGNVLTCDTDADYTRLAFTRSVHKVVDPHKERRRVRINGKGIAQALRLLGHPPVDLTSPEVTYTMFGDTLTEDVWENNEDFESRKSHRQPAPHPTAMHPKLARAMVNLSRSQDILDPFCGSGGILIEAALMGVKAKGVDIDKDMIERARKNLEHFGVEADLDVGDARESLEAEAIVTDLPYGRNSKADDLRKLYSTFLANAKAQTVVVAFPSTVDATTISQEHWRIVDTFTWTLHRSLSKNIYILE